MSRLTAERLDQVEQSVQGTCLTLMEAFNQVADYYEFGFDFDDLTSQEKQELNDYIDNLHFVCSRCGWWCEAGDWITDEHEAYDPGNEICTSCGEYE